MRPRYTLPMRSGSDNHTLLLTLDGLRESVEARPRATIRPQEGPGDVAGQRALQALAGLEHPARTLDMGETLGQGGMGVVRVAEQVAMGRRVAVKTLRRHPPAPRAVLSLLREGWLTGSLEHPNVVPVYDLGLDDEGRPLILMRRIEGEHWGALLGDGEAVHARFGTRDLLGWNLRVLIAVCNAVHFAHARGVIHRDLKPENVMIGEYGEVYVLDWGVAVCLQDDGSGRLPVVTPGMAVAGTPAFLAPEVLRGGPIDARTDIYLLGGILHELLTGRPPHAGRSLEALVTATAEVPSLPPDAPAELAALCRSALDPDPDARPAGADTFRRALQDFLEHRGSSTLAQEAERRLAELRGALGAQPVDHLRVYNLFGEVRFGFRQALRAWPENADARTSLDRAVRAMVRYELARGAPQAAEVLLDELEATDPALRSEVAQRRQAEAAREEAVATLVRDQDPTIGRRTRLFLAAVLGGVWTLAPLALTFVTPNDPTFTAILGWSGAFIGIVAALGLWGRESMSATRFNRQMFGMLLIVPLGQVANALGGMLQGVEPRQVVVQHFALWCLTATVAALTLERRLQVTAVGYGAGFFLASARPDWLYPVMALANATFTANVLWVWGREVPPSAAAPGALDRPG